MMTITTLPLPLDYDGLAPVQTSDDLAYDFFQEELDELKSDLCDFDNTAR